MRYLRASTIVTIHLGPFLDSVDGVTPENALSPTVQVAKAGAAFGARSSATAIAFDADGFYRVELNATDTNTVGNLVVKSFVAGAAPVWAEFVVLAAVPYDALMGTDNFQVDLVQIDGQATSGNNATLNLKQLNVVNNAGSAIVGTSTGGNGHGAFFSGNGVGTGLRGRGGATGDGFYAQGGATSGHGMVGESPSGGHGMFLTGVGAGGCGLLANGDAADGIRATSSGGNGHGIKASGNGSGEGLSATGGATGHGAEFTGGATSGDGIRGTSQAGGNGMDLRGGTPVVTTDGYGLSLLGSGSRSGLFAQGGASGTGAYFVAGGTNKDGITAEGGVGTGHGFHAIGYNGAGIRAEAQNNGHGAHFSADFGGDAIRATVNTGKALSDTIVDAILARAGIAEPTARPTFPLSLGSSLGIISALALNKVTQTGTTQTLRNAADSASIATASHSIVSGTHTRGAFV